VVALSRGARKAFLSLSFEKVPESVSSFWFVEGDSKKIPGYSALRAILLPAKKTENVNFRILSKYPIKA